MRVWSTTETEKESFPIGEGAFYGRLRESDGRFNHCQTLRPNYVDKHQYGKAHLLFTQTISAVINAV